jgi:hypothetical protein
MAIARQSGHRKGEKSWVLPLFPGLISMPTVPPRTDASFIEPEFGLIGFDLKSMCYAGKASEIRGVAQLGSAPLWGSGGRGFESRRSDRKTSLSSESGRSTDSFYCRIPGAPIPLSGGFSGLTVAGLFASPTRYTLPYRLCRLLDRRESAEPAIA